MPGNYYIPLDNNSECYGVYSLIKRHKMAGWIKKQDKNKQQIRPKHLLAIRNAPHWQRQTQA
jgi:hypothetical protein